MTNMAPSSDRTFNAIVNLVRNIERQRNHLLSLAKQLVDSLARSWPRPYTVQVRTVWRLHAQSRRLLEGTAALIRRVDRRRQ